MTEIPAKAPVHHHIIGKEIAWTVVTIIFGIFFLYVLDDAFTIPMIGKSDPAFFLSRIILPIILFSAFLGAFGVHAMIVERKWYRYITAGTVAVSLFLFFKPTIWSLAGSAILVAALLGYYYNVRADSKSRIMPRALYSLTAGLSAVIVLVVIAVSLLFYSTFIDRPYTLESMRASFRDSIVDTTIKVMKTQMSGFSGDLTLDQVIANVVVGRIKVNFLPVSESIPQDSAENDQAIEALRKALEEQALQQQTGLPATNALPLTGDSSEVVQVVTDELGEVERSIIEQVRNQLLSNLGIEAKGTDSIKDVIAKIVDKRVIGFVEPFIQYAPILFTVSLFFVLIIFSFLYRYLTRLFGLIWYGILRSIHFVALVDTVVKGKKLTLDT